MANKLKGNQNVRDDITGQFAPECNAGEVGFNVETDKVVPTIGECYSPWLQKWIRLGQEMEEIVELYPHMTGKLDSCSVAAVIHGQELKKGS